MANKIAKREQMPREAIPYDSSRQKDDVLQRAKTEVDMLSVLNESERARQMEKPKIGEDEISKASQILQKYKQGKLHLESKIIANEEFWKLRQWKYSNDTSDFKPATAWLWSCIQGRYSDAMDSYPTCNLKARQEDDKAEAKKLSSIIPVILEQNRYEETYSDVVWYMLKHGGCVQGVFWDSTKHNGLGDITVKRIDYLNFFSEPGKTDIQESANVFTVELVNNNIIEQRYPQTKGKLGGQSFQIAKYLYDDTIDTQEKSVIIDWYYKTEYNGKKALHYCKFVDNIVLYATENDTKVPTRTEMDAQTGIPMVIPTGEAMSVRGLYDHAMYPFVCQSLYPIEGSICGYGITDIGRDCQIQIDVLNKAITDNAIAGAKPRFFTRGDGTINEEEYANTDNAFIHVQGEVGDEKIRPIDHKPLDSIYVDVLANKVEELKQVTSNQDANNGIASNGVTAASAIAALQETAGKNARSSNKAFHRAYRDVVYMLVELIRQFYDVPRVFRIAPDSMGEEYITYSNEGLVAQQQGAMGMDMGLRLPEFDISVTSEKSNPYKKMEQNELALNFYQQGFFNPQMADQALACLEMMDFDGKDDIMQRIQMNGTLQQMLLQYQQIALQLAQNTDPVLAEQLANNILASGGQPIPHSGEVNLQTENNDEHPGVERARAQARSSTQAD